MYIYIYTSKSMRKIWILLISDVQAVPSQWSVICPLEKRPKGLRLRGQTARPGKR